MLELTLLPTQAPGTDRRELAARCTAAVSALRQEALPPLQVCPPDHRR